MLINLNINAESIEQLKEVCRFLSAYSNGPDNMKQQPTPQGGFVDKSDELAMIGGEEGPEYADNVLGEPLLQLPEDKPRKAAKKGKKEKVTTPPPAAEPDEPENDPFGLNPDNVAPSGDFDFDTEDTEDTTLDAVPEEISFELIRKAANSLAEKGKASEVKKILTAMKLKSLALLQPEQFHKFLSELEKIPA